MQHLCVSTVLYNSSCWVLAFFRLFNPMASWPNYISVTWETILADAHRKKSIKEIILIENYKQNKGKDIPEA